jgi:NADH dehydrogenase FAD-containing subunit
MEYNNLLKELDVPIHLNRRLEEVTDDTVVCSDMNTSDKIVFPADTVLYALGMSSRHDIADSLRHSAPETEVFIVGDAVKPDKIATAVMSAFKAAAYV